MLKNKPTLHLLCGKMASGKSTLAAKLVSEPNTIIISEDEWLATLYRDQMKTGADYVRCSSMLRAAIAPHICQLLQSELSVVLDFAANTIDQRNWMRAIVEDSRAAHQLHFLDVPDDVCLKRLRARNVKGDHAFAATEEQFHRFTTYFVPPSEDEGFEIIQH